MRRRSVITGLAALLVAPEHSAAQQAPAKVPRVGILSAAESDKTPLFDAFRSGLRELGWVEGRNIILNFRLAHGDAALLPSMAEELVNLPVDVILCDQGLELLTAATRTIPIVAMLGDPLAFGLASLSRPGGNVTGFTFMHRELSAKRLEMLRAAFPHVSTVAVLLNPHGPAAVTKFNATEEGARWIGQLSVVKIAAGSAEDLLGLRPTVFVGADGVVVIGDGMFWNHRRDIVALVNAARLPAIYPEREYVEDGGLMAYGANAPDNFHRAADYVDRILKGTKSSDLPIQQPVKFDFVVHLKTAKDLGLTIPPSILARLSEVIE